MINQWTSWSTRGKLRQSPASDCTRLRTPAVKVPWQKNLQRNNWLDQLHVIQLKNLQNPMNLHHLVSLWPSISDRFPIDRSPCYGSSVEASLPSLSETTLPTNVLQFCHQRLWHWCEKFGGRTDCTENYWDDAVGRRSMTFWPICIAGPNSWAIRTSSLPSLHSSKVPDPVTLEHQGDTPRTKYGKGRQRSQRFPSTRQDKIILDYIRYDWIR